MMFSSERRNSIDAMTCIRKNIYIIFCNLTIGKRAGICHTPEQNRLKTREIK